VSRTSRRAAERVHATHERAAALEESLARPLTGRGSQLAISGAGKRAKSRSVEAERLNEQIEHWESAARDAQAKTDAVFAARAGECAELRASSTQAVQRSVLELDRVRRTAAENRHTQTLKGSQREGETLQAERQEHVWKLTALSVDVQSEQAVCKQLQTITVLSRSTPSTREAVASLRKGAGRTIATKPASKSSQRKTTRS
jgi:hypothetical protein